jgi:glycolate oxidase FAD binding subunit
MTIETPGGETELAALIRAAAQEGGAVVTEGGGTKRAFGPGAAPEARRVSLRGLADIVHEPADMILTVGAGAPLGDVQARLAAHDQWLPLDPPFVDAGATMGGILATGSAGPRRLGYGTSRDLLLGVRVVGARGQITRSGGHVVKNVSGYDLHRPQIGAFGTLGVITRAHFKVCARPETSALWALPCATLAIAHGLLLELAATPLSPVALEALDAAEARRLRAAVGGLPGAETDALALVGVEGSRATFERHARDLGAYRGRGSDAPALVERPAVAALWAALANLPATHAREVRVRLGARPHDLPPLLAALELARASTRGVGVRAAVGLAHVALDAATEARAATALVERWHRLASARGGYAVVESAPLELAGRAALPFGALAGPAAALRRAWDPRGTLNPGRMA